MNTLLFHFSGGSDSWLIIIVIVVVLLYLVMRNNGNGKNKGKKPATPVTRKKRKTLEEARAEGIKEGILLEAGFDDITPNSSMTISSWAFDKAQTANVIVIDNKAQGIICYHPGYTFVEKLQTIATKFRNEQNKGTKDGNFMRQYYDVYCLLDSPEVIKFIGTPEYFAHKERRFPKPDFEIPLNKNEAFLLTSEQLRKDFSERYKATATLYYQGQPAFDDLITRINSYLDKL